MEDANLSRGWAMSCVDAYGILERHAVREDNIVRVMRLSLDRIGNASERDMHNVVCIAGPSAITRGGEHAVGRAIREELLIELVLMKGRKGQAGS